MATCSAPLSLSGVGGGRAQMRLKPPSSLPPPSSVSPAAWGKKRGSAASVRAEYRESGSSGGGGGGGGDFLAGLVVGGAVFGTLAYIFAPQIRRSLLNEDEYGFRRVRKPVYYDEGLERTRQTLNEKISQLNSAIDNVSSRLRGAGSKATADPQLEVEDPTITTTTM